MAYSDEEAGSDHMHSDGEADNFGHQRDEGGNSVPDEQHNGGYASQSFSTGVVEINEEAFEELALEPGAVQEVQAAWAQFLRSVDSREAAGEAIYAALFEAAPSLQSLFKTPRAVMAMRFMGGLNNIIRSLDDPKSLKTIVETLGFQHLNLEVTSARVVIFRDAILDLLSVELGEDYFTSRARDGLASMLNYVGGAYIYIRVKYTDRLKTLASSWATANNKKVKGEDGEEHADGGLALTEKHKAEDNGALEAEMAALTGSASQPLKHAGTKPTTRTSLWSKLMTAGSSGGEEKAHASSGSSEHRSAEGSSFERSKHSDSNSLRSTTVPTTFNEMFTFNAAVMGFGSCAWMAEVLSSFDTIVCNVSNSYRLQEECDVLSLRMAKYKGVINLSEFKAVMLASLRSLVPKDWNSEHEVAWSWLWENVERMLKANMGKPAKQERALEKLWASIEESRMAVVRRQVYYKFFALSPAGQDFFKQSSTRLDFIADRIVAMTLEIYKEPRKLVEDISALGLRHVGYGIPTELFGPFVTAAVQVIRGCTNDDAAEESFRWSLSLISRILVRVINEGSTIVMKAINANSGKQLRRAVGCAPRSQRALWMLNVQVGTQSISPLLWAIKNGSLDAAKAMVIDLLTIRADRDNYYYGADAMFERHGDIVKHLCSEAPELLTPFLDGFIWRSRLTTNGQRRVNYYVKHLLVDAEGKFSKALEWFTETQDPKLICHPVLVLVTDVVWSGAAFHTFLMGKAWFLFNLAVFVLCQSIMDFTISDGQRFTGFIGRMYVYAFSMGGNLVSHVRKLRQAYTQGEYSWFFGVPWPHYLENWQESGSLLLTLVLITMLCIEPTLHCLGDAPELFALKCNKTSQMQEVYSVFAMIGVLLYFMLLMDLSVFSTRISAFVLVCFRIMVEVVLFIGAMVFLVLTFSCAATALDTKNGDFEDIPGSALSLLKVSIGIFAGDRYEALSDDPALMIVVICFTISALIFLLNMLIAQLNSSYNSTYQDMLGLARLNRSKVVVETMPSVPHWRWQRFLDNLQLDKKLEFNEGDVGLAGGIQVTEPANANPSATEAVRRYGGSTAPSMQWPQEDEPGEDDEADRFDKLEKLLHKVVKKSSRSQTRKGSMPGTSSMTSGSVGSQSSGAGSEEGELEEQR